MNEMLFALFSLSLAHSPLVSSVHPIPFLPSPILWLNFALLHQVFFLQKYSFNWEIRFSLAIDHITMHMNIVHVCHFYRSQLIKKPTYRNESNGITAFTDVNNIYFGCNLS